MHFCMGNYVSYKSKHVHNEWQMGCQPIMEFRFHKCQSRKTSFILHTANHLHHNQLSQFDILKEVDNQNAGCCHQTPHPSQKDSYQREGPNNLLHLISLSI